MDKKDCQVIKQENQVDKNIEYLVNKADLDAVADAINSSSSSM